MQNISNHTIVVKQILNNMYVLIDGENNEIISDDGKNIITSGWVGCYGLVV